MRTDSVPPQNLEAEESVLGAMMLAPAAIDAVHAILDAGHFYRESHGKIFRAALYLHGRGDPVDAITLTNELEQRGELDAVGGRVRLHELARLVPATANVHHYAGIVRTKARRRSELAVALGLQEVAMNGGLHGKPELLDDLRRLCEPDLLGAPTLAPLDLAALLSTEVAEVDWLWGTWLAHGDLALLVGDPGVGKSLLALSLVDAVRRGAKFLGEACKQVRVGMVDLENPLGEVHKRLLQVGMRSNSCAGIVYVHGAQLDLTTPDGVATLEATIEQHELDLVVIDSLRRAAPGLDENDSAQIAAVFAPLRALTATSGRSIIVIHHARKRIGDNPTDAGQMVRGSGDLVASVDVLLYARSKGPGAFTLEHGKARRGFPHDSILVRIENESEEPTSPVRLVNEGPVVAGEDKVEVMLARILRLLRDTGGPLERQTIALRIGVQRRLPYTLGFLRELVPGRSRGSAHVEMSGHSVSIPLAPAELNA